MIFTVSAATITDITAAPDFAAAPPPPPLDALTAKLHDKLSLAVRFNKKAAHHVKDFESLMRKVPEGFRLAPVYYVPIPQDLQALVKYQYLKKALPRFFAAAAERHREKILEMGIKEDGLACMAMGRKPVNAAGYAYGVSVDHIVERAGCGIWAYTKAKDPDLPGHPGSVHLVNRIGNLYLMPEHLHLLKSNILGWQTGNVQNMRAQWLVTLAPERNDMVCPAPFGRPFHLSLLPVPPR